MCDDILVIFCMFFFFFKQKTAYEMRISDWSSDVCSSDLLGVQRQGAKRLRAAATRPRVRSLPRRRQLRSPAQSVDRTAGRLGRRQRAADRDQIRPAHVGTPVANASLVCRLLLDI